MSVLVTWGSKRGGTQGIARMVAEELRGSGLEVEVLGPREALRATGFEAAVVGGALYANRWHRAARRFVRVREKDLRRVPVWLFSSGPLDDSSEKGEIPPTAEVSVLMGRVGAQGHATFGGRLASDARGFPASAMARKHSGDWRNESRIRAWAREVARALPSARPGPVVVPPGGSLMRLLAHAAAGWAVCAAAMGLLLLVASTRVALAVHAAVAPLVFWIVARHYFAARGARGAMTTALAFLGTVVFLDLVLVAGVLEHSLAMFTSVLGSWLPFALLFGVTWAAGEMAWMVPARHEEAPGSTV